ESGALELTVYPLLDGADAVACSVEGSAGTACRIDGETGQLVYEALGTGPNIVRIEIREDGQAEARVWEHAIERVVPDVVVFGATPAGITAAVAAARENRTVALIEPTQWVGGAMSGGLAKTDMGRRGHEVIGGIAD